MRQLKPCGTPAAYSRHLRHHEQACAACRAAEAARCAAYRAEVAAILRGMSMRSEARRLSRQDRRRAPQRRAILAEAVGGGSYGGIAGGS